MKTDILPSAPVTAFIQLTSICNNSCPGCSNKFLDPLTNRESLPKQLLYNDWKEVLLKLKPHVTRVRITGGEPTLHPDLEEILEFIREIQIPFALFTNGRWKEPTRLLEYLKRNQYFKGLLISLHGADVESHEAFSHIPGSFDETIANIRLAIGMGLGVHTNSVITKQNYHHIERLYNFARVLGVSQVVISRYIGRSLPEIQLSDTELKLAISTVERMIHYGAKIKHSGCVPQCFIKSGANGCTAGYTFFTVDPWGNVCPCNHVSISCGNLLKDSIEKIWYSDSMQQWRKYVPNDCLTCGAYLICHGGCHAAAQVCGQVADPLMTNAIDRSFPINASKRILLNRTARPILNCTLRTEPFGYLLIKDYKSVPVTFEAKEILMACNGMVTLEEIYDRFGQKGIDLIGVLIKRMFLKQLN